MTKLMTTAAVLIALIAPAMANDNTETCIGKVRAIGNNDIAVIGSGYGCGLTYTGGNPALVKQILKTCPLRSTCRIVTVLGEGDSGIAEIISIKRIRR